MAGREVFRGARVQGSARSVGRRRRRRPGKALLTAANLVRVVTAIVLVVALKRRVDAAGSVGATELVEPAGRPRTPFLVLPGAAVQVAIAALLLRHADVGRTTSAQGDTLGRRTAPYIIRLALTIRWCVDRHRQTNEMIR